jgi:hypothetical protein
MKIAANLTYAYQNQRAFGSPARLVRPDFDDSNRRARWAERR